MVKIWKGPKNRIGILDSMCRPGDHPIAGIIRWGEKETDWVRIELDDWDSTESQCGDWREISKIDGYDTRKLHPICKECGQEIHAR